VKTFWRRFWAILELTASLQYLRSTLACGKTQSEHVKIRCMLLLRNKVKQ